MNNSVHIVEMSTNVLDIQITFLASVQSTKTHSKNLYQFLIDPPDKVRELVNEVRYETDQEQRKIAKSKLPVLLIGGVFTNQNNLNIPSGLILIDIDLKDNPGLKNIEAAKEFIMDSFDSVAYCGLSVGGGLFCLVYIGLRINSIAEYELMYASLFTSFIRELRIKTGLVCDPAVGHFKSKRFISYDDSARFNESAKTYYPKYQKATITMSGDPPRFRDKSYTSNDKIKFIEDAIRRNAGDRLSYYDWSRLAAGLHAEFGEDGREYFHRLSCTDSRYSKSRCDTEYSNASKYNEISFGTVYHLLQSNPT